MEPKSIPLSELPELLAIDLDRYFQQLVLRTQQPLYAFALRQAKNSQDAEDIVQEAFIRAYHALATYPAERIRTMKIQAWLYKITLHIFYRHTNNSVRLQCIPLDLSEESSLLEIEGDEEAHPEKVLEDRENVQELESRISQLPEHYRVVVSCYYFAELSYAEIAQLLHLPMGTVKSHVYRGTQLLRKTIAEYKNVAR